MVVSASVQAVKMVSVGLAEELKPAKEVPTGAPGDCQVQWPSLVELQPPEHKSSCNGQADEIKAGNLQTGSAGQENGARPIAKPAAADAPAAFKPEGEKKSDGGEQVPVDQDIGFEAMAGLAKVIYGTDSLLRKYGDIMPDQACKFMLDCRTSFQPLLDAAVQTCDAVMLERLEKNHFKYFQTFSDPDTGLTLDRSNSASPSSIAGIGFSLSAHLAAAERGWISRDESIDYTLKVLRTLSQAPQGETETGTSGYKGFFYHFINPKDATRAVNSELSTVDTALLMAGVVSTAVYFDKSDKREQEIRELSKTLYEQVDWNWAMRGKEHMSMGWYPDKGFIDHDWRGYNEGMLLMVLGLASPTHPISAKSWQAYTDTYDFQKSGGKPYAAFGPLFGHQYSHAWIDFRNIKDDVNRKHGFDYFENSQRAVQAQHDYALRNPLGWFRFDALNWGLTASDGPGLLTKDVFGKSVTFHGYRARGAPGDFDDGTIAPTAVASSLPFAPDLVLPTLRHWTFSRPELWSKQGFKDAYNPSFDLTKPSGWIASDTLAIDQGPIVMMLENHRSGFFWSLASKNKILSEGLSKAGFSGGWLQNSLNSGTRATAAIFSVPGKGAPFIPPKSIVPMPGPVLCRPR